MVKYIMQEIATLRQMEKAKRQRYHKGNTAKEIFQLKTGYYTQNECKRQTYQLEHKPHPGTAEHLNLIAESAYQQIYDSIVQRTYGKSYTNANQSVCIVEAPD